MRERYTDRQIHKHLRWKSIISETTEQFFCKWRKLLGLFFPVIVNFQMNFNVFAFILGEFIVKCQ